MIAELSPFSRDVQIVTQSVRTLGSNRPARSVRDNRGDGHILSAFWFDRSDVLLMMVQQCPHS